MSENSRDEVATQVTTEKPVTSTTGIKTLIEGSVPPAISLEAQKLRDAEASWKKLHGALAPSKPSTGRTEVTKEPLPGLPKEPVTVQEQYQEALSLTQATTSTGRESIANLKKAIEIARKVKQEIDYVKRESRFEKPLSYSIDDALIKLEVSEKRTLYLYSTHSVTDTERVEAIKLGSELAGKISSGLNVRTEGEMYYPNKEEPKHPDDSPLLETRVISSLARSIMEAHDTIEMRGAFISKTSHEGYRLTAYKLKDEVGPKSFETVGIVWIPEESAQKLEAEYEQKAGEPQQPFIKDEEGTVDFTPLSDSGVKPSEEAVKVSPRPGRIEIVTPNEEAGPKKGFMLRTNDGSGISIDVKAGDRPGLNEDFPTESVNIVLDHKLPPNTILKVRMDPNIEDDYAYFKVTPAINQATEAELGAKSNFIQRIPLKPEEIPALSRQGIYVWQVNLDSAKKIAEKQISVQVPDDLKLR